MGALISSCRPAAARARGRGLAATTPEDETNRLLEHVGLKPFPLTLTRDTGTPISPREALEMVIFSKAEPTPDDAMTEEDIVELGFLPEVAKKIAARAAVYTTASCYREAALLAAMHFIEEPVFWFSLDLPPGHLFLPSDPRMKVRRFEAAVLRLRDLTSAKKLKTSAMQELFGFLTPEPRYRTLYHATSIKGAKEIIEHGVKLRRGHWDTSLSRGDFTCDGHPGYYTVNSLEYAAKVAHGQHRVKGEKYGAIIVHKVPNGIKHPHHLSRDAWQKMVKSCILDNRWPDSMKGLAPSHIAGRVCANPCTLRDECATAESCPSHSDGFYQLCVLTEDLAEQFTQSVAGVLFVCE